ncbi:MAG: glycosyltransferase, partial [Flavobacteriaceae bacterium]|nr:glycosyltransferase [Flavobacteriaceae bacterium]
LNNLNKMNIPIQLTICYYKEHQNSDFEKISNIKVIWSKPLNEIELRKEYIKNDFFISFARYEPFGIAFLEAMNAGLLFLVTDTIGLVDGFNENLKKYVVPFGNWEIAREKLNYLISLSKQKKQELSNQIIEFSNQFTWDRVVEKYFRLYDDVNKNEKNR